MRMTAAGILAAAMWAQAPAGAPAVAGSKPAAKPIERSEAALSVSVNEVIVPVTVTDDKGRFVTNLEKDDFKVYEDGKLQKISYFTRERNQPVVVGFLLDLSNASRLHWKNYQESAMELALALLPETDKRFSGYLVTYSNTAELAVNTTNDPSKITERIRKVKPGGGAALYDAIYLACTSRSLVRGEPLEPRRVIIVIGDGHDNASKKTLEEVVEIAQRNLVTIYGVSTVAFGFNSEGDKNLQRLTEDTGGRVEYPLQGLYKDVSGYLSTPSDEGNYALKVGTGGYASEIARGMFRAVANVAGEVTTQYILRYSPEESDSDRKFRNLRVDINLANVSVRARKGYYSGGPPGSVK